MTMFWTFEHLVFKLQHLRVSHFWKLFFLIYTTNWDVQGQYLIGHIKSFSNIIWNFYFGHDFLAYIMVIIILAIYVHDFQTLVTTKNFLKIGCDNPTSFHWNFQNQSKLTQFKQYLIDLSNITWRFGTLMEVQFSKFTYMLGPFEVFPFYSHILILLYGWMFHTFLPFQVLNLFFIFRKNLLFNFKQICLFACAMVANL
jgi:hypothetical protein